MHIAGNQINCDDQFPATRPPLEVPNNWSRGELIGAGAFGRVYLGLNNDNGELVAVKQVVLIRTHTHSLRALA